MKERTAMPEIAGWLEKLGMSEYAELFAENKINMPGAPLSDRSRLRDCRILHDADVYSDHTIENNGLNRRPHAHSRQPLGDGRVVVPHAAELENSSRKIRESRRDPHWIVACTGAKPDAPGRGVRPGAS